MSRKFPQIVVKHNIGNTVNIPNQLDTKIFTYMADNVPIGETHIPVDNAAGFSIAPIPSVEFDAFSEGGSATNSLSFSHTCTGTNRILWVGVECEQATPDQVTGVTYAGVAMTQAGKILVDSTHEMYLYFLVNPATGANNVVVSATAADILLGRAESYTGAKQVAPTIFNSDGPDNVTEFAISATTVDDNSWLVGVFSGAGGLEAGENTVIRGGSGLLVVGDSGSGIIPPGVGTLNVSLASISDITGIVGVMSPADIPNDEFLLLLGNLGAENSEIIESTSHDQYQFITNPTTQIHNRGELVQEIKYDQVSLYKSSTLTGVYTLVATETFQTTQQNTIIFDVTGLSTDYYKVQWKNSITGDVSDFSDPISVLTYPTNSVAQIIYPVIMSMGVSENDPKINTTFLLSAVNDARKYTAEKLYGVRHAWLQKFEFPIKVLAGSNYVELPDDIDFNETDRSLLAARFLIGNVLTPFNLRYIDKRTWNQVAFQVAGGTTELDESIGTATIELDSVGDFPDVSTGVAYVACTDFDQTIMEIEYTGVNLITNQLTGVTGVTRAIPAGTRVWSNPTIAQPIYYTVYENKIVFDRLIPDSMQGNNLYIDYYKKLDEVNDLYMELPEHYREIYKWYLKYAIKYRKDINLGSDDPDLKKFEGLVLALFNNLYTGQDTVIVTS